MKTCKDCIHYEACLDFCTLISSRVNICKLFKDKSKFIELPCSIGENNFLQKYMNNLNSISYENLEIALKQMENADDVVGCTIKWLIENQ